MGIIIPLLLISFACLIIWRAGDGFMAASEYIGRNLSEGVRGATINAIASSMPEVFTSFFFLFVMMDGDGFSGGIGTTAGSAIFNSMVIPAVSVIAVVGAGMTQRVEVSRKVLLRDGIALIIAEFIFLVLISGTKLDWYHGLVLMFVYMVYLVYMLLSMRRNQKKALLDRLDDFPPEEEYDSGYEPDGSFMRGFFTFDLERVFIGHSKIGPGRAWALLLFSTLAIAGVCYFLVIACEWIGEEEYTIAGLGTFEGLGIPVMFVALILASAASSFPDTMISIKDAKKGQYDDALSNALGSNIFDVCFALGLPLFVFTLMQGPIEMDPEISRLSTELRFLLLILTIFALLIFVVGKYIGKTKALIMLTVYFLFVLYIVGRSAENPIANSIADVMLSIVHYFGIN
ncbi:MAG: hypothetical protein WBA74_04050 [Cyclobacteriaceae bacterium]